MNDDVRMTIAGASSRRCMPRRADAEHCASTIVTLNAAHDWIAQEPSEAIRRAAEALPEQALVLPQPCPDQRDAAITHRLQPEANVPP